MIRKYKNNILIIAIAIILLMSVLYQIKLQGEANNLGLIIAIVGMTIIFVVLSSFIAEQKKFNEKIAFKILIPIVAICFIVAMPIFKSHDEDAHWLRIYDISLGNFLTSTEYGKIFQKGATNYPAAKLPRAVYEIVDKSYEGTSLKDIFNIKIDKQDTVIYAMPTTAIYAPIQYLPQATGVVIARIFTDRPIIMAYTARIMNIIMSFTVLYFAIKFMPFCKKILLVIISIPIALEGFTSLSPDAMTISVSFLFVAYLFNLTFEKKDEKLTGKQYVFLTTLACILALCKIVYLPIVGLVLLLPKTKFSSRKSQILHIAIIMVIAILMNLIWLSISTSYLAEYKEGRPVNQLQVLLSNPIEYLEMMIYSIDLNGAKYFLSMLGGEVGLNEYVNLNTIIPFIFFILTLIATFSNREDRPKFSNYQILIISLIVIAVIGLIFTSLYIQWTKTESESIMGIQGRYFIPILPLVLVLLGNLKIKIEYSDTTITKWITILILMMQIYIIPLVFCIRKVLL